MFRTFSKMLGCVFNRSFSVSKREFSRRACASLHARVSTFVFVSLCPCIDCQCASSCVVKHGGVSLYAHYSPPSSISLAALRHYPSPRSLYEYLTSPQASLLSFHTPPFILSLFLLSTVIPFCRCFTHLSVSVSPSCKSFLPLFPSLPICMSVSLYLFWCSTSFALPYSGGGSYCYTPCPLTPNRCFLFNLFRFIEFNYF